MVIDGHDSPGVGYQFLFFPTTTNPRMSIFLAMAGAKVNLAGPRGATLEWVVGIGQADMRRIMVEIQTYREMLAAWRKIHE